MFVSFDRVHITRNNPMFRNSVLLLETLDHATHKASVSSNQSIKIEIPVAIYLRLIHSKHNSLAHRLKENVKEDFISLSEVRVCA